MVALGPSFFGALREFFAQGEEEREPGPPREAGRSGSTWLEHGRKNLSICLLVSGLSVYQSAYPY